MIFSAPREAFACRICILIGLLSPLAIRAAEPATFMDAFAAYQANAFDRCADIVLAVERGRSAVPFNGELLGAECLGSAGRPDEAIGYLARQLPQGRINLDDLRHKDRPGLNAVRKAAGWPALLAQAETRDKASSDKLDPDLRRHLLDRVTKDQQARESVMGPAGTTWTAEAWKPVAAIDRDNTAWLKAIVAKQGWPLRSRVGVDGAKAAFLLVQHADLDSAFQQQVLPMMEKAATDGEADRSDVALLTDRVLLAANKPQRYGTQFQTGDDGTMRVRPVEDMAGLDARRAAVDLPPMAEYRKQLHDMYGTPVE